MRNVEKLKKLVIRHGWEIGIFGVLILAYVWSMPKGAVNYADAEDFILASYYGGVAHHPTYPLQVLWFGVFIWILGGIGVKPVIAAGLANGLLQALCASLMFTITAKLIEPKNKYEKGCLAAGMLIWATTAFAWQNATMVEAFSMTNLLIVLMIVISSNKGMRERGLWGVGILGGLLLHAHQLGVFWLLPIGWWMQKRFQKLGWKLWWGGAIVGFMIGLGLMVILNQHETAYSWKFASNVNGLMDALRRSIYLRVSGSAVEKYANVNDGKMIMGSLGRFGWIWFKNYYYIGFLVIALGFREMVRKYGRTAVIWLSYALLVTMGLVIYFKMPSFNQAVDAEYFWGTAIRLRMFFGLDLILGAGLAIGSVAFYRLVNKALGKWVRPALWVLVMVCLMVSSLIIRSTFGNRSHDNFMSAYTRKILNELPEDAVLVVNSDIAFSFLYQHLIDKARDDMVIIPESFSANQEELLKMEDDYYGFNYSNRMEYVAYLVAWNVNTGRRVFLYSPSAELLSFLGVDGRPFYAIPNGYLLEIKNQTELAVADYDYGYSKVLAVEKLEEDDYWNWGMRGHLAEIHTQLTYYLIRMGLEQTGAIHYQLADELAKLPVSKRIMKQTRTQAQDEFKRYGTYLKENTLNDMDYLKSGDLAVEENDWERAYYMYTRGLLVNQMNEDLRERLVSCYKHWGRENEAREEEDRLRIAKEKNWGKMFKVE